MRFMSLTYGNLPTREQFEKAFIATDTTGNRVFAFGNDPRVGTCELTCDELWTEVCKATEEFNSDWDGIHTSDLAAKESSGDWASAVLGCIGIEWI